MRPIHEALRVDGAFINLYGKLGEGCDKHLLTSYSLQDLMCSKCLFYHWKSVINCPQLRRLSI